MGVGPRPLLTERGRGEGQVREAAERGLKVYFRKTKPAPSRRTVSAFQRGAVEATTLTKARRAARGSVRAPSGPRRVAPKASPRDWHVRSSN